MKTYSFHGMKDRHRKHDTYNIDRKVSFTDMMGMHVRDIKAKYNIDDRELNRQIRHETYDCNEATTKEFSNQVYFKGAKDVLPPDNPMVQAGTGKYRR